MTNQPDDRQATPDARETDGADDLVLARLAAIDPTMVDAPPAPGSARHLSILEHAMTTTTSPTTEPDEERPSGPDSPRVSPFRRRRLPMLAAAAVILAVIVVVVGVVVLEPGRRAAPASARQVVQAAATTTGDVSSLRAAGTYDLGTGVVIRINSEIDGADYSSMTHYADGSDEDRDSATTYIGDTRWDSKGGRVTKSTEPPEQRNAPFPEASEAVVKAAMVGASVTDLGTADVRGQEATHYRIQLTPASTKALSELTPSQVARFELEYPKEVASLDVWVADDLIRRIAVRSTTGGVGTSIVDFYDFGADITIRPPQ